MGLLAENLSASGRTQIEKMLKELEATGKPAEACRQCGVSDATIYNWRKRDGDLSFRRSESSSPLSKRIAGNLPPQLLPALEVRMRSGW